MAISGMRNSRTSFSNWRKNLESSTSTSTSERKEDESGNRTEQSSLQTTNQADDSNSIDQTPEEQQHQQQQWTRPFLRLSQAVRSPIELPNADASLSNSLPDETDTFNDPEDENNAEEEAVPNAQGVGLFSRFRRGAAAENDARIINAKDVCSSSNSDQKDDNNDNNNNKEPSQGGGGGFISFFVAAKAEMKEKARLMAEEMKEKARLKAEEEARIKTDKEAEKEAEEEAGMKAMEEAMKKSGFEMNFSTDDADKDNDGDSINSINSINSNDDDDDSSDISMTASEISDMRRVHLDLEEIGLPPVFTVQDHDHHSHTSCISLGEESYVLDLLHQKEKRDENIREESLEEALELYLVATVEKDLPESEEMFQMILQEVLNEVTEKGKEKAVMQDEILERKKRLVEKVLNKKQWHETTAQDGGLKKKLSNLLGSGWR